MSEHTTIEQNRAHRNDAVWIKTGKTSVQGGQRFGSTYSNVFTGQTIAKGYAMTGADWHIWDAAGSLVGRVFSLSFAKYEAAAR